MVSRALKGVLPTRPSYGIPRNPWESWHLFRPSRGRPPRLCPFCSDPAYSLAPSVPLAAPLHHRCPPLGANTPLSGESRPLQKVNNNSLFRPPVSLAAALGSPRLPPSYDLLGRTPRHHRATKLAQTHLKHRIQAIIKGSRGRSSSESSEARRGRLHHHHDDCRAAIESGRPQRKRSPFRGDSKIGAEGTSWDLIMYIVIQISVYLSICLGRKLYRQEEDYIYVDSRIYSSSRNVGKQDAASRNELSKAKDLKMKYSYLQNRRHAFLINLVCLLPLLRWRTFVPVGFSLGSHQDLASISPSYDSNAAAGWRRPCAVSPRADVSDFYCKHFLLTLLA